jgi:hypothetical protein
MPDLETFLVYTPKEERIKEIIEKLRAVPGNFVSGDLIVVEPDRQTNALLKELRALQTSETPAMASGPEKTCTNVMCPIHGPTIKVNHVLLGTLLQWAVRTPHCLVTPDQKVLDILEMIRLQVADQFNAIIAEAKAAPDADIDKGALH